MKIVFGIISLFLVLNVSGCSIALIERPHIVNLQALSVSDQYVASIQDKNGDLGDVVLDIEEERIRSLQSTDMINDSLYKPEESKITAKLNYNGSESTLYFNRPDQNDTFSMDIDLNGTYFDDSRNYVFFASESLKLAYLVFPYDIYHPELSHDNSSLFIIPLNNVSEYTFSYTISNYYFWHDIGNQYDQFHVIETFGSGADCVGAIYIRYSEIGFEVMFTSNAWSSNFVRLDLNRFIKVEHPWNESHDLISVFDEHGTLIKDFTIKVDDMLNILNNNSTANLELDTFSSLTVVSFLVLLSIYRKRK